jgi:maleylpyruvate isomerase
MAPQMRTETRKMTGMTLDQGRPELELAGVDAAFELLADAVSGLDDADARGASRLPGWTCGHVLTHLARNADGQRRMVEGAVHNEVVDQYPGGNEQRTADIEAGAGRPMQDLVVDVHTTQRALDHAWSLVPDDAWDRLTNARAGTRPVRAGVLSRWRELLVHLVDLDVGVGAKQLPASYCTLDIDWLAEYRPRATWPDAPW